MAKYSFAELTQGGGKAPAKFSFAELTRTEGADVAGRLKTDLDFEPTPEEAKSGYNTPFQLPDVGSVIAGAESLVTEQLPALAKKGFSQANQGNLAERASALPATVGEALLQGTMGLGQMILPPVRKGVDELAAELQDPSNMAKRLRAQLLRSWLSPELRDKVAPEVPRSPQQEAAAVGAWVDRVKAAGDENRDLAPILEGDKTFLPGANPGYSALAGNFLDPTMLIPAAGAAKLTTKAGKLATKTAAEVAAEASAKGGVIRSAAGAAAPAIEKAAAVTGDAAEVVGRAVDKAQPILDVAGLIQGGLPGAGGAHAVGRVARAATKWASKLGHAGTGVRNIAKTDWNSTWTVAKQLAKDSDAPAWLRRAASSSVAPLVETSVRAGSTAVKGAAEGAAIGAAAAGVNDTLTPEERDQAIGAGAALGTGGALAGKAIGEVSGRNALVRQSHDIAVRAHRAITEGANPASVLGASDATMFYADNIEKLFKGAMPGGKDLSVRLMDNTQFQAAAGPDGTAEVARFVSTPDGGFEVHINLDVPGADARLLHEAVGHGLIESVVGNNPDALARARSVFSPEMIPIAEGQYAEAILPTGTPEERAAYVTQQRANSASKYGSEDVWILSELLSESAVQSTAGKSLHDIANPGFFPVMERLLGRENKFSVSKNTFFKDEIADALTSPELTEISTGRLADIGKFRPGIDLPSEAGVKVKPVDWGKAPHAPLEDLGGGKKGNDFVESNPTTGAVVPRTPMQVRKRLKNRRDVVNQEIPDSGDPAPFESATDDLVRLRRTISGLVERSGTRLGQWFFDSPVFSETHKGFARALTDAMRSGDTLAGWYHQIGEGPDWKESVGRDRGNITAQFKDFVPINFAVSKAGNLLVRNYSLTAFERKAQLWGSRQGPASLELWNGDIGQFRTDVQTYLKSHSDNRPGSDGIGEQKRDVINAFLVGGNRAFEAVNPLRTSMRGADRQGIVRSYRLDRLETLEPSEVSGFARPSYEKQVRNLSPDVPAAQEPQTQSPAFRNWFRSSKVVDELGAPIRVFHGTGRPDRVGDRFRKGRATSGPMAFFTMDPEVASKYAIGKKDTSLDAPSLPDQFKVRVQGVRQPVSLSRAWSYLDQDTRHKLASNLEKVTNVDENGDSLPDGEYRLGDGIVAKDTWAYEVRRARGNVLEAAAEMWVNSGTLFGNESEFRKVLEIAGLPGVTFDDPNAQYSAVYPVYLSIQNPLDTGSITPEVARILKQSAMRSRKTVELGADNWDKRALSPSEWLERFQLDQREGTTHAWTSIPDFVTKALKGIGYDGIKDTGGKLGGPAHVVWIPFEETQIKSSTGNRGTFDPERSDIRHSPAVDAPHEMVLNLTAATKSLPGIRKLLERATRGDAAAEADLQGVSSDALSILVSGIEGAEVVSDPTQGVFGSSFEPAIRASVRVPTSRVKEVLAAAEKFADNFNQWEIHRREQSTPGAVAGTAHNDGSFDTVVARFTLDRALSPEEIAKIAESSGLSGFTQRGNSLETYYVDGPNNPDGIAAFKAGVIRAKAALGTDGGRLGGVGLELRTQRLWRYGREAGPGVIPYSDIRGDVRPAAQVANPIAIRLASRLRGKPVEGAEQAREITPEQRTLQTKIAEEFERAPINELDNPIVRKAYEELGKELVTQFEQLPVKVEVLTGRGEPYRNSAEMRRDVAQNNHLFIFGTESDTFGPKGVSYDGHPLLEDSGHKDINGRPLLKNDLLRAVHDYYAHTMSPVEFGPKGEEAAWKNHMRMTRSPWARMALTTETRGQNSVVNFGKNADFNSKNKEKTIFADQKVTLLDPEYSKIGDPDQDRQIDQITPKIRSFIQRRREVQYSPAADSAQPMKTSAVSVLYGDSDVLPPPTSKKKRKLKEVAGMIQQVAMDQWDGEMITSSTITPDQEKVIVDNAVNEVKAALSASGKNAYDWYTMAVKRAVEVLGVIHPELVSDEKAKATGSFPSAEAAQTGMMMAMAISSQNLTVNLNSRYALEQFEILSRTGRFDVERADEGYGTKSASIASNFRLANTMIEQGGWESLTKFLKQDFTVGDLSKAISEVKGRKVKIAGRMGDVVQGAAIFGPKIGQGFLQNLFGNFTPVTVDLWMRRTWGRWTGDVVGDGVTPERLARLIDGARAKGIALPKEITTMRTVTRKGENGSPYKTVSEAVSETLETDESIRDIITRYSIELAADWNNRYKTLRFQPVTPEELANLRSGGLNLEDLSDSQLRLKERLNTQYSRLANKPKKADWVADRLKRGGYTESLTKDDINPRKPEWAGAAVSIKNELGPIDIPSDQDRAVITRIVNKVRAILESEGKIVTNADLQAILWYPEKDLWEKLMSGKPESRLKQSYDDEFIKIATARGLGEAAKRAIADFESRTKSTDRTSRDSDGADTTSDGSIGQKTDKN